VSKTAAALSALIAAALWGTTGTTAYLIGGEISALAIGAATMGVGGLILLVIGGWPSFRLITSPVSNRWVLLGGLGVVIYPLAFYQGMFLAGVAVGNVVALGTGPIVVALLEWGIERRRPSASWLVATLLAVIGVLALSLGDSSKTSAEPGGLLPGIALALVAGVSYALFSYAMGHVMSEGHSPRTTVGAVFGAGSLPLLVILVLLGIPADASAGALGLLGYLILGPMVVSYVFFSRSLRVLTSSSVLTLALIEPAVATVLALAVVGERFDPLGTVGLALIICGVIIAARRATVR
jgi:DME family drug/metabolite transporter